MKIRLIFDHRSGSPTIVAIMAEIDRISVGRIVGMFAFPFALWYIHTYFVNGAHSIDL